MQENKKKEKGEEWSGIRTRSRRSHRKRKSKKKRQEKMEEMGRQVMEEQKIGTVGNKEEGGDRGRRRWKQETMGTGGYRGRLRWRTREDVRRKR